MEQGQAHDQSRVQRRLLIVDDEEKVCQVLAQYFSLKRYEVRAVCQGEQAVAVARIFHPDVVLLDLLMPGMSGVDTLKALKQLTPTPKVLILSAADHEDVVKGALDLGADFYICKPPQLPALERLVNGFWPPPTPRHQRPSRRAH